MINRLRLGIDLGGSKIEGLLIDRDGAPLWRQRTPTPAGDYRATVEAIAGLVETAREAGGRRPLHIGIGTPGSTTADGLVRNANSTCLNGRPLQRDLETALGQPLRLANDANCLALSESADGAGAGAGVVFAAILGTGVGAGLALHGRLHVGPNGLAGEWGHNPLPWSQAELDPAPPCYCGQFGCIEALVSGPALAADHRRHGGAAIEAEGIDAGARDGDPACAATLARHADRLARALAAVINLVDPDLIVLGGGLSRMAHLYTQVPARWQRWVFAAGPNTPVRTQIVPALHGDASGVRGAARLWDGG